MDYRLTGLRFEDNMRLTFKVLVISFACSIVSISHVIASDWQSDVRQTEAHIAQAKAAGGLWRDTEKFLEQAKELHANGNQQEAYTVLQKATQHSKLGYQQASNQ